MKKWLPLLVVSVLSVACSDQSATKKQVNNTTKSSDIITVGAVLPFSGGLEIFGEQAKAGIDLAVEEVNTAGGINGKTLKVVYEDNKTDVKTSVEKATKLVRQQNSVAILGPINSSARDAMTPTLKQLKTPLLYATNYEGGVCEDHVYSFNTVPNQELQQLIPAMAQEAGKSFYLFGTDYVWPQKMFEQAETEIAKVGGTVVGKTYTPWAVTDFTPIIRKIMKSDAKVLVFAVPGVDGTTFIKQAHKLGLTKKMTIAFLGFSETYIPEIGDTKGMNVWTAVPFVSTSAPSKTFVDNITQFNPKISGVSHYAYSHYNAVKALSEALTKSQDYTAQGVATGLKGLQNNTIHINADNQADMKMFIAKIQENKLQTVKDLGMQKASVGCKK